MTTIYLLPVPVIRAEGTHSSNFLIIIQPRAFEDLKRCAELLKNVTALNISGQCSMIQKYTGKEKTVPFVIFRNAQ